MGRHIPKIPWDKEARFRAIKSHKEWEKKQIALDAKKMERLRKKWRRQFGLTVWWLCICTLSHAGMDFSMLSGQMKVPIFQSDEHAKKWGRRNAGNDRAFEALVKLAGQMEKRMEYIYALESSMSRYEQAEYLLLDKRLKRVKLAMEAVKDSAMISNSESEQRARAEFWKKDPKVYVPWFKHEGEAVFWGLKYRENLLAWSKLRKKQQRYKYRLEQISQKDEATKALTEEHERLTHQLNLVTWAQRAMDGEDLSILDELWKVFKWERVATKQKGDKPGMFGEEVWMELIHKHTKRRDLIVAVKKLMGGECFTCGYLKDGVGNWVALEFHHYKGKKRFAISSKNLYEDWKLIDRELTKTVLLCRNCHVEITYPQYSSRLTTQQTKDKIDKLEDLLREDKAMMSKIDRISILRKYREDIVPYFESARHAVVFGYTVNQHRGMIEVMKARGENYFYDVMVLWHKYPEKKEEYRELTKQLEYIGLAIEAAEDEDLKGQVGAGIRIGCYPVKT